MARRRSKSRRRGKPKRPPWTPAHVRRLFWRAGFGATGEEARAWARRGRKATIAWLLDGDGEAKLRGPEPSAEGKPLDPVNENGHDVLWWLDRMVRTTRPLEEKLTLFWHDHFATRDQDRPLMLEQNRTLRAHALGPFDALLRAVTLDTAMQHWQSLAGSHKSRPNENYARELMELFTIGTGYTEHDVREAARALTGFVAVKQNGRPVGVRFDPARHDAGPKTIFGRTGNFGWEDVLKLCLEHPNHAPLVVGKLWDFFVGTPLPGATRARLVRAYRSSGLRVSAVVRRILAHPALYERLDRPDMVKWPVVYVAGQLRAIGAPVATVQWVHMTANMGQRLFAPPSVAGWDWGTRWLSSNAMRQRFMAANVLIQKNGAAAVAENSVDPDFSPDYHLPRARAAVGDPEVTKSTDLVLRRMVASFAAAPEAVRNDDKTRRRHAEALQRALRHLLISGPDNQLH